MTTSVIANRVEAPPREGVRVIRDEADLEQIRELWENLKGDRDSDPTVFLSILHTRAHVLRPHVIVAYRDGQPRSMLVGRLIDEPLVFGIGYARVRLKARTLYFVYGGARGSDAEEYCDLFVREISRSLKAGEADAAYLNYINVDSALYRAAGTLTSKWRRDDSGARQPHFSATLPESSEAFYASLSYHARKKRKNMMRKLEKTYPGAHIRVFQAPEEIDVLAEAAESIMHTSYQRGLGVGFMDSPESRDQLRRRAQRGWLRGYVLYLEDSPIAFWIGDLNQQTYRSDYTAYRSEYSAVSPGMYLMLKTIEQFCDDPARNVTEVDLALGQAEYKEMLGNRNWQEAAVYLFAPSAKGLTLRLARGLTSGVDTFLKRVLTRLGLLQKIKKRWRMGLTGRAAAASAEKTASAS